MSHKIIIALFALVLVFSSAVMAGEGEVSGVVNINTAGAEELQLLPRVGPALAERIIEFRTSHGPFGSIDEIVAVKGIGDASLDKLEPYLTTDGATTLETKVKLPRSNGSGSKTG